jgi:hypothetical protein
MLKAKVVKGDIIVVQVSARKWRIAKQTRDGRGYSNFNSTGTLLPNVGLTGIREYEFITEPLTFSEYHKALEEHTLPNVVEWREGISEQEARLASVVGNSLGD